MKTLSLIVLLLAGCADYGVSRYSIEPIILADGSPTCCKVSLVNGKEIGRIKVHLEKKDGYWLIDLDEQDVKSFEGQQIASDAVSSTAAEVANTASTAILAPTGITAVGTIIKGVTQ